MTQTSDIILAVGILAALFAGFAAMTVHRQSQALVMPMVAAVALILAYPSASAILSEAFGQYAPVAIAFTAVAIAAHLLQRAGLFQRAGAELGAAVGEVSLRQRSLQIPVLAAVMMGATWLTAMTMHNITAIMVMVPVIIAVSSSYGLPSRWLLCGALVASNLGGFSSAIGDTPNIIEARVWSLAPMAFLTEILPINLAILLAVTGAVAWLTARRAPTSLGAASVGATAGPDAMGVAIFREHARDTPLDRRLLMLGGGVLIGYITSQFIWPNYQVATGAAAILIAVGLDRPVDRLRSLHSLSLDVHMTLLSVFVIAHAIGASALGAALKVMIADSGGAPWAIALSSYLGTGLTEAASWAASAAPATHAVNASHGAAWALGGGICAGSSSLLTAASAGVILWQESRRFPGHAVNFRDYAPFGLTVSLAMLAVYVAAITAFSKLGFF